MVLRFNPFITFTADMHGGDIIIFRMSLPLAHPHGTGTPPPTPNTEAPLQMPPQSDHGASSDWLSITAAVMLSILGAVLVVAVIVIIASMANTQHDHWFTSVCGRSYLLKLYKCLWGVIPIET